MFHLTLGIIFAGIGSTFYKLAEEKGCSRLWVNTISRLLVVLLISLHLAFIEKGFHSNLKLLGVGLLGGVSIFFGRWLFLQALHYGKVSVSWTVLNLAVIIPILASIIIWKETPDIKKTLGIVLFPLSVLLLRKENKCG